MEKLMTLSECAKEFIEMFGGQEPFFIMRQGGSDYNYVVSKGQQSEIKEEESSRQICEYNGYYDKTPFKEERLKNLSIFCRKYEEAMRKSDFTICVQGGIEKNPVTVKNTRVSKYVLYSYIENLPDSPNNFLLDIFPILSRKRVLVVSPFGPLIKEQYLKRNQIFEEFKKLPGQVGQRYREFKYPEFVTLESFQTDITYNGGYMNNAYCPDESYHETIKRYKTELKKLNYDVALLCCGAYTNELGLYIKEEMKKQSIYMGGALQLYFGIKGDRYSYLGKEIVVKGEKRQGFDVINESWVEFPVNRLPEELRRIQSNERKTEGMGAYFVSSKYGTY